MQPPQRIRPYQLDKSTYSSVSKTRVTHDEYEIYLDQCLICGDWVRSVTNACCGPCYRKSRKRRRCQDG